MRCQDIVVRHGRDALHGVADGSQVFEPLQAAVLPRNETNGRVKRNVCDAANSRKRPKKTTLTWNMRKTKRNPHSPGACCNGATHYHQILLADTGGGAWRKRVRPAQSRESK